MKKRTCKVLVLQVLLKFYLLHFPFVDSILSQTFCYPNSMVFEVSYKDRIHYICLLSFCPFPNFTCFPIFIDFPFAAPYT